MQKDYEMKKLIVVMVCFWIGNAVANCENDILISKTPDSSVLTLSTNGSWEIDFLDRANLNLWLPMDDIQVCDGNSLILKKNGQKVSAQKI